MMFNTNRKGRWWGEQEGGRQMGMGKGRKEAVWGWGMPQQKLQL
jgi:hypothetical protein